MARRERYAPRHAAPQDDAVTTEPLPIRRGWVLVNPLNEYLVTGVTGLVGSHVLYALLARSLETGVHSRVHLLIRAGSDDEARRRLDAVLDSALVPESLHGRAESLRRLLHPIAADLAEPRLPALLAHLRKPSTTVIHCAASTDLRPSAAATADVIRNNTVGTRNLLNATRGAGLFTYVSTAYSCGLTQGSVQDSYRQTAATRYRNSYERQKGVVENELRALAGRQDTRSQIVRPAVVCGRLHEDERFVTSKFDVFYGWAKFFWAYRQEVNRHGARIWINPAGTLNIVPVDYVAGALLAVTERPDIAELNIVSDAPPKHTTYFGEILAELGVSNVSFVDVPPRSKNRVEKHYYRSVAPAFNPYITTPDASFDATLVQNTYPLRQVDVGSNMRGLVAYAVRRGFRGGFPERTPVRAAS